MSLRLRTAPNSMNFTRRPRVACDLAQRVAYGSVTGRGAARDIRAATGSHCGHGSRTVRGLPSQPAGTVPCRVGHATEIGRAGVVHGSSRWVATAWSAVLCLSVTDHRFVGQVAATGRPEWLLRVGQRSCVCRSQYIDQSGRGESLLSYMYRLKVKVEVHTLQGTSRWNCLYTPTIEVAKPVVNRVLRYFSVGFAIVSTRPQAQIW
jgi:hypothetical protein